jgi:hypothetical protein
MFAVVPGKSKLQEQCISCESLLRHALVAPMRLFRFLSLSLLARERVRMVDHFFLEVDN